MRRLMPWGQRGFLALLDQGLFSGANFLVNVLLARWLSPREYGAFAVALSVYYFLMGFHNALLTEPMMVFGAGKYREQFRRYFGSLLYGHGAVSLFVALGLGGTAWMMHRLGSSVMAQALAGLAVASPLLLFLPLNRRACYAEMQPGWAVVGSGINLLVASVTLILLWQAKVLSSLSGIVLLGVSAGIASMALLILHLHPRLGGVWDNLTLKTVVLEHWRYGSWNILGFLAYWISSQLLLVLVPIFLGLSASAAIAAVWNLYRPVGLLIQSLGAILLPTFSQWVYQGMSILQFRRRVERLALILGSAAAAYGAILTLFGKVILHLLYGGKYDEHWLLIVFFGVSVSASIATGAFVSAFKAFNNTFAVANIWGITALFVAVSIIPLIKIFGLTGAMMGFAASYSATLMITVTKFSRDLQRERSIA